MGVTCFKRLFISLHFAKKTHENRSGESRMTACQTLWGSKSKVAETHFLSHTDIIDRH